MKSEAELCRAIMFSGAAVVCPRRVAAALLLMKLAHDDLELPLDEAPDAVRALLDVNH